MYSLTRVWIGAKLARMLIQVRVVVSTTRASDRPSTPSLYWMPKSGIQISSSTNWKPARRRASKPAARTQRDHPGHERGAQGEEPGPARPARSAIDERADERQER